MEAIKIRKSDWQSHLDLAAAHPRGMKGYCRETGIKNSRLHYWKKKLEIKATKPRSSRVFAAVEVVSAKRTSAMPDPRWLAEFLLSFSGGVR